MEIGMQFPFHRPHLMAPPMTMSHGRPDPNDDVRLGQKKHKIEPIINQVLDDVKERKRVKTGPFDFNTAVIRSPSSQSNALFEDIDKSEEEKRAKPAAPQDHSDAKVVDIRFEAFPGHDDDKNGERAQAREQSDDFDDLFVGSPGRPGRGAGKGRQAAPPDPGQRLPGQR